jgi:transcriptional accessory protein Tex/SPT6
MNFTISTLVLSSLLLMACDRRQEQARPPAPAEGNDAAATGLANPPCVDLNQATADKLMKLPGVGEVMSRRIVDYRERHGPFRRPAEVIILEGFSEKKYRAIAGQVCVAPVRNDE